MTLGESRSEQARQFYNAAASASQDFAFMNYGYAPLSAELAGSAEPEKYCLQLYRRLIGNGDLRGKKVVEVSCGRGGGAAHVAATYQPRAISASTSANETWGWRRNDSRVCLP